MLSGRVGLERAAPRVGAEVRISVRDEVSGRLAWTCSICDEACEHGGAVLSLILEDQLALGLARPPRERVPVESLGEEELLQRALADRKERARSERMTLRSSDPKRLWTDYSIEIRANSAEQYREKPFFTICNYEQVLRDILSIE